MKPACSSRADRAVTRSSAAPSLAPIISAFSEATSASVTVTQTDQALRVRIEDDGRGGAAVSRGGLSTGLAGLTDRVRATGGHLEVASPHGGGTVLMAVIPLDPRPGAGAATVQEMPAAPATSTMLRSPRACRSRRPSRSPRSWSDGVRGTRTMGP